VNFQGFRASEHCQFLTLAPAVPAPFTGKLTGSSGVLSGTLNKIAPVSGLLLQDVAFGEQVRAGLIKFPTVPTPAVRGSFEAGAFILENAPPEWGFQGLLPVFDPLPSAMSTIIAILEPAADGTLHLPVPEAWRHLSIRVKAELEPAWTLPTGIYSAEWGAAFGSIPDESFVPPPRGAVRGVEPMDDWAMAFFIDTNIWVAALRGRAPQVKEKMLLLPPEEILVPHQVLAELRVGAAKSARPAHHDRQVNLILSPFAIVWPDEVALQHYVAIRGVKMGLDANHSITSEQRIVQFGLGYRRLIRLFSMVRSVGLAATTRPRPSPVPRRVWERGLTVAVLPYWKGEVMGCSRRRSEHGRFHIRLSTDRSACQ